MEADVRTSLALQFPEMFSPPAPPSVHIVTEAYQCGTPARVLPSTGAAHGLALSGRPSVWHQVLWGVFIWVDTGRCTSFGAGQGKGGPEGPAFFSDFLHR